MSVNKTLSFKYRRDAKKLRTENINFKLPSTFSYQQEISIDKMIRVFNSVLNCENADILILLKSFPNDKIIDFYLDDEGLVHLEDAVKKCPFKISKNNSGDLKLTSGDSINEQFLNYYGFEVNGDYLKVKRDPSVLKEVDEQFTSLGNIINSEKILPGIIKQGDYEVLINDETANHNKGKKLNKNISPLSNELQQKIDNQEKIIADSKEKIVKLKQKINKLEKKLEKTQILEQAPEPNLIDTDEEILQFFNQLSKKQVKEEYSAIQDINHLFNHYADIAKLNLNGYQMLNSKDILKNVLNHSKAYLFKLCQDHLLYNYFYFENNRKNILKQDCHLVNQELKIFGISLFIPEAGDRIDSHTMEIFSSRESKFERGIVLEVISAGIENYKNKEIIYKSKVIVSQ